MLKRLAIIALLVLYGLTGSVAAFADDDRCAHRGPAPQMVVQSDGAAWEPSTPQPVDQDAACCGFCHLLTVAELQTAPAVFPVTRPERGTPVRRTLGRPSPLIGVPTPPPNFGLPLL